MDLKHMVKGYSVAELLGAHRPIQPKFLVRVIGLRSICCEPCSNRIIALSAPGSFCGINHYFEYLTL
jgi:hypothetical protein